MVEVSGDGVVDVAVAEVVECVVFPGVALASVDGELGDGRSAQGGGGESAAGSDLGKLVVVTNKQDTATSSGLDGDGGGEGADVGHCGFVDDQE